LHLILLLRNIFLKLQSAQINRSNYKNKRANIKFYVGSFN